MKKCECRPHKDVTVRIFVKITPNNSRLCPFTSAIRGNAPLLCSSVHYNQPEKEINEAEFSKNTAYINTTNK